MIYDAGNPGFGLGQVQKCGRFKPVNGIPTLPLLIIGYFTAIQIYSNDKKNLFRLDSIQKDLMIDLI